MPSPSSFLMQHVVTPLVGADRKVRVRLLQWLIASLVYVGAAALLVTGVGQGWMDTSALLVWLGFVAGVLVVGYVALRSRWSERFEDPSMTVWQLSMGVVAVNWGYLICGPMRTSALFPLMIIFAFGAFTLRWRQIAFVTVLAVLGLVTAVALRTAHPEWVPARGAVDPLRLDINNVLMILVVLPALAVIAARLSGLRQKLRDHRARLEKALEDVERLATTDELTSLPNRRSVRELLSRVLALSDRGHTPCSIAVIDIDHFKQINDRLGHAGGDEVLRSFAALARRQLRDTDVLGRWGGEEFLLVLPGTATQAGVPVLERMRRTARESVHPGCAFTFSAGLTEHRPGESLESVIARADEALYRAKREGRDRHVLA